MVFKIQGSDLLGNTWKKCFMEKLAVLVVEPIMAFKIVMAEE